MPKVTCTSCGSTNTARQETGDIYYIAEHNPKLKKEVDAGKVVLTGCEPSDHNRYCYDCSHEFDTPAYARAKSYHYRATIS